MPRPLVLAALLLSVASTVAALYASISGPRGAPRDFDCLRTLFDPSARLIPTGVGEDGKPRLRTWSVEEYIAAAGPGLMANGFFEREIWRGVNSIQLFNGGDRWYVISIFWDSERPGNPIPPERITVKPDA